MPQSQIHQTDSCIKHFNPSLANYSTKSRRSAAASCCSVSYLTQPFDSPDATLAWQLAYWYFSCGSEWQLVNRFYLILATQLVPAAATPWTSVLTLMSGGAVSLYFLSALIAVLLVIVFHIDESPRCNFANWKYVWRATDSSMASLCHKSASILRTKANWQPLIVAGKIRKKKKKWSIAKR